MEQTKKREELVAYLTAIWKPIELLKDSSKPARHYLVNGLFWKKDDEWIKLTITERHRGGILCIKVEKQEWKVAFHVKGSAEEIHRTVDRGRIFWDNREHEAGFPALRTEAWEWISPNKKHLWDEFVAEWLPLFRRNCYLSGCDVECTAHEKAEWHGYFKDEFDEQEEMANLSKVYGYRTNEAT